MSIPQAVQAPPTRNFFLGMPNGSSWQWSQQRCRGVWSVFFHVGWSLFLLFWMECFRWVNDLGHPWVFTGRIGCPILFRKTLDSKPNSALGVTHHVYDNVTNLFIFGIIAKQVSK